MDHLFTPFDKADVCKEYDVHHQRVKDARKGYYFVVENEGTGGKGNGLRCILHADLDDDGATFLLTEAKETGESAAKECGAEKENGDDRAEEDEVVGDDVELGNEEDDGKGDECREGNLGEHFIHLTRSVWSKAANDHADDDWQEHKDEVLLDEVADREMEFGFHAYVSHHERHDHRDGKEGDDAAEGSEGDRQGDVALGKTGEDVGGAAARRTGDEHEANEKRSVKLENQTDSKGYQRKADELAQESDKNRTRTVLQEHEVIPGKSQAQVEHEQCQDGQNDKDCIHR